MCFVTVSSSVHHGHQGNLLSPTTHETLEVIVRVLYDFNQAMPKDRNLMRPACRFSSSLLLFVDVLSWNSGNWAVLWGGWVVAEYFNTPTLCSFLRRKTTLFFIIAGRCDSHCEEKDISAEEVAGHIIDWDHTTPHLYSLESRDTTTASGKAIWN